MGRAVRSRERHARTSNGPARALSLPSRLAAGTFSSLFSRLSGLFSHPAPSGSSGSASRPRPFRPAPAAAFAAAFSLLFAAGAVEAQTSVTLVDNTAQSTDNRVAFDPKAVYGQGFTTGSHGGGYKLKDARIDVFINIPMNTTEPDYSVSIWSAGADGFPDSSLDTLTNPTTLIHAVNTFTASGDGIDLDADTTYFVVLETTSAGDRGPQVRFTASDSEDSGGATGWSIADRGVNKGSSGNWANNGVDINIKMAVHGHENEVDHPPSLSSAVLVTAKPKQLRLNFDEALDTGSDPGAPAFSVRVKEPGLSFSRLWTVSNAVVAGSSVTLTLAKAVPSNATSVTVGYDKSRARQGGFGHGPIRDLAGNETVSFANEAVDVRANNRAPVFTATSDNPADNIINAPSNTLVSLTLDRSGFSDPDGDALTLSLNPSRDDTGEFSENTITNKLFYIAKGECELANLEPLLVPRGNGSDPTVTATLTATDPYGATASITRKYLLTSFFSNADVPLCPQLGAAVLDGTTLTLSYRGRPADDSVGFTPITPSVSASEFTVTVNGRALTPSAVSVGSGSASGDVHTTPVTLTLPEAAWGGDTVTVSHRPGASPTSAFFRDFPVTVDTSNRRPTATVADEEHLAPNADPDALTTADIVFADPNITSNLEIIVPTETDPNPTPTANQLLVTVAAEPANAVKDMGYAAHLNRALFTIKDAADLCALAPRPDSPFTTTVTVTATDSDGASVSKEIVATTAYACGPVLATASVDVLTLTLTYGEPLDENSVPATGDFAVTAAGDTVSVTGVDVSGRTVALTLASAVGEGEAVTVSYTKGTNPIRRAGGAGDPAESFTGQMVTNIAVKLPTLKSAVVHQTTLTLLYDEALDQGSVPATGDFAVTVAGSGRSVTGVEVTHSAVVLTLAAPAVTAGQSVTVSYTRGANPIRDTDANRYEAAGFSGVAADNRTSSDTTAPGLLAATVQGHVLTLTYDETLAPSRTPAASRFQVDMEVNSPEGATSIPATVTAVTVAGRTMILTLGQAVTKGQNVTLDYDAFTGVAGDHPIQDLAGNVAADIEAMAVTYGPPPAEVLPVLQSAWVDRTMLTLDYGEPLNQGSVPATGDFTVTAAGNALSVTGVDVSGSTVVLTLAAPANEGETVTVSYIADATKPIQRADGTGEPAESFTNRAVTNVTETPALASALVDGRVLTLTFDEALDEASEPAPADFTVTAAGNALSVSGVDVSGSTVVLTLAPAVSAGQRVTVSYTRGANPIRRADRTGSPAVSFTDHPVMNVTETPPASTPRSPGEEPAEGTPVASAGADVAVDPGASVTLDGSGSTDPDGDALSFAWTQVSGASVTLSGAATARATFTAPAESGAMVFRLTVTDPGGLAGSDEVTVTVRDTAPVFGAPMASLVLTVGEAMEPAVLPAATGGNGALSYALTSDPAGLAGLDIDAATRTLSGTPESQGEWVFTWRADDADANRADTDAAILTFQVTVADARTALVKRSVRRTLAAVARRALSSALDNIAARFAASVPASGLTLAGETVPFGVSGAGPADVGRRCVPDVPGRLGQTDAGEVCAPVRSRSVEAGELMQASAFSLTLGEAGGSDAPLWAVWGRGDLGTFAGRPEGMSYEGELRTGWLGIDARSGPWVAGLAVSHGTGEADYRFDGAAGSGEGRLETDLTALYPYGRWTLSEDLELHGVLGAGRGEARHRLEGGEAETSDLVMWMGSAGLRHALPALAGIDLAVRADASLARLETDDGPDYVDGLTADSWRLRTGLEASRRIALDGDTALVPFVEAAARRDGGDGLAGSGLETVGGVRYTAPRFHVEARGRWLAAHSEEGAEERGVSVTARVGPGAQGRGLSLMLSPHWGAGTGAAEALWGAELPTVGEASGGGAMALDARIGYGLGVTPYGLLTPFAETGVAGGDSRRLRLGTRFEAERLHVEFAGERREGAGTEHLLRLDVRLRF